MFLLVSPSVHESFSMLKQSAKEKLTEKIEQILTEMVHIIWLVTRKALLMNNRNI